MKVLLVEDDPFVARALMRMMQRIPDLSARHASDVDAAEAAFTLDAPDLIVVDVGLPNEGGGMAFVAWAEARRPDVRVVVTSGAEPPPGLAPGHAFLGKPFTRDGLIALLTGSRR